MKWVHHAKEGLRNLLYAKLRSALALLGILVGSASVVAMVLGGELATNEALKQFKSLGTDLLAMTINEPAEDNFASDKLNHLTLTQTLDLAKADQDILNLAPYTQLFYPISYNGNAINGVVLGVTGSFADVVRVKMQQGRFIASADQYAFYCVIGHDVYEALKKISHREPLGSTLQIGGHIFVIVGVADAWQENSFIYANIDNAILIPLLASTLISKYAMINNMIMRLTPSANITNLEGHLRHTLQAIAPDKQISFRSAKELIAKMRKQSDILTIFLGLIGSISLVVGGIGVMNIMLVSVVERRREIGIRLAVGAKPKDIALLFFMEAIMLSFIGGLFGVLLGTFIAYLIALFCHWQFSFYLWPPFAGFSVSVAVGIFFGFYPAYLASRLDPIEALRSES